MIRAPIALRCALLVLALGAGAAPAARAQAPVYPDKPVRILSPYPSGAGPDLVARVFADKLTRLWKQQVIIDSRPGANGFIALEAVRRAAADGYTLAVVGDAHLTINPHLFRNTPYDPQADFTPIALQYRTPFFVAVATGGPYPSVQALLAAIRSRPGRVSVGLPYIGSPAHLGAVNLEQILGSRMVQVPFKENGALFAALSNGDIDWVIGTIASAGAFYKSGKLQFLAVIAPERLAAYPQIPTLAEAGGPAELNVGAWVAFIGPRGVPADIVQQINRDTRQILSDQDFRERMSGFGFIPSPESPAALAERIRADLERNGQSIRQAHIRVD